MSSDELHEARNANSRAFLTFSKTIRIAFILEIRAKNPSTVFARVGWFYRPDELPDGRQPYHGAEEVIKSPWQDIIKVHTVVGHANVTHWNEEDNTQIGKIDGLYWRQSLDPVTGN